MALSPGDRRPSAPLGAVRTGAVMAVIGHCSVAGCRRPATRYVEHRSPQSGRGVAGAVCTGCARATEAAAFLLDLIA
jgi:hypothetical protein